MSGVKVLTRFAQRGWGGLALNSRRPDEAAVRQGSTVLQERFWLSCEEHVHSLNTETAWM